MARKPTYTPDQVEQALRGAAGIYAGAAIKLRCTATTVANYVRRHKRLQKVCEEIVEENLDLAEGKLLQLIGKGNLGACIFYLKTKGKSRGYVERAEVVGAPKGTAPPIAVYLPTEKDE